MMTRLFGKTLPIALLILAITAINAAAATFPVTNTNDSGAGSLRQAILDANAAAGSDTITFDAIVFSTPQTIVLAGSVLTINNATGDTLTITGPGASLLTVSGNNAVRVFAISSGDTVSISGLTITQGNGTTGSFPGFGGGIYNQGILTLTNVVVTGNSATIDGGGVYNSTSDTLNVINCTISNNIGDSDNSGSGTGGGGLYSTSSGVLTVTNSTITGNSVGSNASGGGGIAFFGPTTITNCTISGNSAGLDGGGIFKGNSGAALTLTNSTVVNNTATRDGGGVFRDSSGTFTVRNSIIANNTDDGTAPDFGGTVNSQGYNLIENTTGTTILGVTTGNITGVDPNLGPLQNNGGPTATRALQLGSPAIDTGKDVGATGGDQRGGARPVTFDGSITPPAGGDRSDIGAVELPPQGIYGTISYCSNPVPGPVPNVTLAVTGTSSGSTLSDGSGNYTLLSLAPGGNYTVTPTKAALAPSSEGVTGVDAVATQRHFLNLGTPLSGCRLTAADVTGTNGVDGIDAVAIQRFFLGFTSGIANVGKYQFTPLNRSYVNLMSNQIAQNYDTIVFGDVASSFVHRPDDSSPTETDDGTSADEVPATVAEVALPEVTIDQLRTPKAFASGLLSRVKSESKFIAAVTTTAIDPQNELVGFQGDITFDEREITFQSEPVQKAGITGGNWNVTGNVLPGTGPIRTLRISAYSNDFTALSGSGTLFELRMSKAAPHTQLLWAASPDEFIFIDADLKTQKPGYAASGGDTSSGKRQ